MNQHLLYFSSLNISVSLNKPFNPHISSTYRGPIDLVVILYARQPAVDFPMLTKYINISKCIFLHFSYFVTSIPMELQHLQKKFGPLSLHKCMYVSLCINHSDDLNEHLRSGGCACVSTCVSLTSRSQTLFFGTLAIFYYRFLF